MNYGTVHIYDVPGSPRKRADRSTGDRLEAAVLALCIVAGLWLGNWSPAIVFAVLLAVGLWRSYVQLRGALHIFTSDPWSEDSCWRILYAGPWLGLLGWTLRWTAKLPVAQAALPFSPERIELAFAGIAIGAGMFLLGLADLLYSAKPDRVPGWLAERLYAHNTWVEQQRWPAAALLWLMLLMLSLTLVLVEALAPAA